MYRVNELPDGLIPWNEGQMLPAILHCIIAGCGMLSSLVILVAHIGADLQANLLMTLSLVLADFVYLSTAFVIDVMNISAGGFTVGRVGCTWEAMLILVGCFGSVSALLASTFERYLHIMHQRSMTPKQGWFVVLGMWAFAIFMSCFPSFFGIGQKTYGLNSGLTVCVLAWWDGGPSAIFTTVVALITLLICTGVMFYCYFRIVASYVAVVRKVERAQQSQLKTSIVSVWGQSVLIHNPELQTVREESDDFSPTSPPASPTQPIAFKFPTVSKKVDSNLSRQERLLLTRALVLTMTFLSLWSPYLVKVFQSHSAIGRNDHANTSKSYLGSYLQYWGR
jgi:hypothetical protein